MKDKVLSELEDKLEEDKVQEVLNYLKANFDSFADDPEAYLLLSRAYIKSGAFKAALKQLSEYFNKFPRHIKGNIRLGEVIYELSLILAKNKKYKLSRQCSRLLSRIDTNNFYFRNLNVKIDYLENKDRLGYFNRASEVLNLLEECEAYFKNTKKRLETENWPSIVLETLNKVEELDPLFDLLWENKGILFSLSNKFDNAIKCFSEAARLNPSRASIWNHLGLAYLQRGRYEDALRSFNKALELDSNYEAAVANVKLAQSKMLEEQGDDYKAADRLDEAYRCYDEAYTLSDKNLSAKRKAEELLRILTSKKFDEAVELLKAGKFEAALEIFKDVSSKTYTPELEEYLKVCKNKIEEKKFLKEASRKRMEEITVGIKYLEALEEVRALDKFNLAKLEAILFKLIDFDLKFGREVLNKLRETKSEEIDEKLLLKKIDAMIEEKLAKLRLINIKNIPREIEVNNLPLYLVLNSEIKNLIKLLLRKFTGKLEQVPLKYVRTPSGEYLALKKSSFEGVKIIDKLNEKLAGYLIWVDKEGNLLLEEVENHYSLPDKLGISEVWELKIRKADLTEPRVQLHKYDIIGEIKKMLQLS
ncbi:MAG: tetratricopeptide repeat protein [Candidatus Odinarchaeia archaeon]